VHRTISQRRTKVVQLLLTVLTLIGLWLAWPQSLGGDVAYARVSGHSMDGTYRTGDLVIVTKQSHYSVGDIVDYRIPKGEFGAGAQVIHRIIGGNGRTGFITQGDNRTQPDDWHPRTADVVGHAWIRLPGIGVWFSRLATPLPLGALCAGLTMLMMLLPRRQAPTVQSAAIAVSAPSAGRTVLPSQRTHPNMWLRSNPPRSSHAREGSA
jgi:signal peptidase